MAQRPIPNIPINPRSSGRICSDMRVTVTNYTHPSSNVITGAVIPAPVINVDTDAPFKNIEYTAMVDDVVGDSSTLIPYISATMVEVDGAVVTTTDLGDYTDDTLQTPYAPVNGVSPDSIGTADVADIFSELRTVCMVDDVNGDSSLLVKYYDASKIKVIGTDLIAEYLGSFATETLVDPYTPNNPTLPENVGSLAVSDQIRILLTGGTWSPTSSVQSYSLRIDQVADVLNPPTFTDSNGTVTSLEQNEFLGFENNDVNFDTNVTVTAGTSDRIYISYTELST